MENPKHVPVLLDEVLSFVPKGKIVYLDLTLGRAGHAEAVLEKADGIRLFVGVDRDEQALKESEERLKPFSNIPMRFLHSAYAEAFVPLKREGLRGADFILMDIGVSSPQFDSPERGFSYRYDGPLDMRMDRRQDVTAAWILKTYTEKQLADMFFANAQCPCSRRVAHAIVEKRRDDPIDTTMKLVSIIRDSLPVRELEKKGHPAKQFFLALRYEVNGELTELAKGLEEAMDFLTPGGRLAVISFNFEEDRIVKNHIRARCRRKATDKFLPQEEEPDYFEATRKPLVPSADELERNNRAKSAILRVVERRK